MTHTKKKKRRFSAHKSIAPIFISSFARFFFRWIKENRRRYPIFIYIEIWIRSIFYSFLYQPNGFISSYAPPFHTYCMQCVLIFSFQHFSFGHFRKSRAKWKYVCMHACTWWTWCASIVWQNAQWLCNCQWREEKYK